MLAKQGWRLLTNPQSLLAQLYKAQYYPNSSIWEAELGARPSFSWRSIMQALPVLKAGIQWKVGNGRSINIWQDRWIPINHSYQIVKPLHCSHEYVSDLIDAERSQWKEEVVKHLFPADVATKILCIPISRDDTEDRLVWLPEKRGFFSVKTAYWIARADVLQKFLVSGSNGDPFQPLWKALWKANVPAKVQVGVWRACQNLLATTDRLLTKGYDGEVRCMLCSHEYEDVSHLFCKCPTAYNIFTSAPFNLKHTLLPSLNFKEWMLERACSMPIKSFEQLLMIIWSLWKNRNNKFWSNTQQTSIDLTLRSFAWLGEFQRAKPSPIKPVPKFVKHWKPPPTGSFKLNVDAAFLPSLNQGGTSGVLRDSAGKFIAVFAKPIPHSASVKQSELLAIRDGVDFLYSLQIHNVLVESDCTAAICEARITDHMLLPNGALVGDIQHVLGKLHNVSISYALRDCNRVAHKLASIGFESPDGNIWLDHIPSCIADVIQYDCNHLT